ncbi:succinate dehydrogenase, hydrophobic membrane anchor protein [Profundibacterium mesophilum]|uniref:Succinate dehydrogenase hydrophobic membrane anchor subunit n=1 Tax=Profundibacterium mesophilum KAUST100406-0324 TaxID=1037889 RepID=A0A921TGD6_9RHOB|nr:succinate dehydrogenase, hydrophobic membrane anchor protein [Profundibacterium mesophilum]KAF0677339.1 Succinate dehydrogenase hydrophobic membrane anchor [Profundibacterium mesophilum KAUST100406-0324]
MRYLTSRKQVDGLGAARTGTTHFWRVTVSSLALLILVPLFVFTFGRALGQGHIEVLAYYSHPFPALVAALTLAVGWLHFKDGVRVLLEDYVHGHARQIMIVLTVFISYGAAAAGLYALARIAF